MQVKDGRRKDGRVQDGQGGSGSDQGGRRPGAARFRVLKILNNNTVLARDTATGRQVVLQGRGLGFRARSARDLAAGDPGIETVFEAGGAPVPAWLPAAVTRLAERAARRLGEPLDPHIVPALLDHLAFAVHRVRQGLPLENPFLPEIQVLFPEEYRLAREALADIAATGGVELPADEAGFIALHLQAARTRVPVRESVRHAALVHELVEWVREELGVKLQPGGLDHARLVAHLRYLLDTVARGGATPNPLLPRIEEEFPEAMALARRLGEEIARRLGRPVQDSDLGYVALHLAKLRLEGVRPGDGEEDIARPARGEARVLERGAGSRCEAGAGQATGGRNTGRPDPAGGRAPLPAGRRPAGPPAAGEPASEPAPGSRGRPAL